MEENLNDLIPANFNEDSEILISERDLHEFLGIKTPFRVWHQRMIAYYGFEENEDYKKVFEKSYTAGGEQAVVDYMISVDMAKEIAMVQRSIKGKTARKYFIEVEKKFRANQVEVTNALPISTNSLVVDSIDFNLPSIINTTSSNLTANFRDTAKLIGVRENLLVNWLLLNNYCYRDKKGSIKPYAKFMDYFAMREFTTESGHSGMQTLINAKGREIFKALLRNENVIKNEVKLLE